jgi:hypothetical protein
MLIRKAEKSDNELIYLDCFAVFTWVRVVSVKLYVPNS